ncbi:DUF3445 domain-containing protein [Lysinibacillus fusiformis]|nr:DUF3445 domain-containing protein [Lysinibacillus fusiformis]
MLFSSLLVETLQTLPDPFPFPFHADQYRYSNNSKELDPPSIVTITKEYKDEILLKRELVKNNHDRCYQAFPETMEPQWEIFSLIAKELQDHYPEYFSIEKYGSTMTFTNHLLNEQQQFEFGKSETLPYEPLDFIGRHIQEDLVFLSQRDGDLYMDAGQLCFPANWSLAFNIGMTLLEFHSPVPVFSSGLAKKVRDFLLRMEIGKPWTRLNWSLTVGHRLDTFPENYDQWGKQKSELSPANIGELLHLRVEHQKLFRLPASNGILFSLHTYLKPFEQLIENDLYKKRLQSVIKEIPDYMADYKGFSGYQDIIVQYLDDSH